MPNGFATTYHFSYLPEAAYQANLVAAKDGFTGATKLPAGVDPSIGSGTVTVTVAQTITSMTPDTAYRYRVQATNSAGTSTGLGRVISSEAFATGTTLLDGRGWELVSPLDKGADEIPGFQGSFGGGVIQAAAAGSAFTYSTTTSFGQGAGGAPPASQHIARRGAGGWSNENVTVPTASGGYRQPPDGTPYRLFSADLSRGLMLNGRYCAAGDPCPAGYSLRDGAGGLLASSPEDPDLRLAAASPGLGSVVLSSCAALTPNAIDGCALSRANLYLWAPPGGLSLINLPPAAVQGVPGAAIAAPAGAVSEDGSRIYWTDLATGALYLRESGQAKQVDDAVGGAASFQAASADGARALFTKGGRLYRYVAATGATTDLTVPAATVAGVLGASADGLRVYYLTNTGLYLNDAGTNVEVASAADSSNYPPATGTARVTPDGLHLAFLSGQSLTGHDNRHRTSGLPQTEVFLYEAAADELTCASCDPTGERPLGPSTIPGAIVNGSTLIGKPRNLSDDGTRLFFDSDDALAIQDTGGNPDAYEWEARGRGSCQKDRGCLGLISRGRTGAGASFLDASAQGSDVFFLTADSLVGSDTSFADVYDAREGGGFSEPAKPIECAGDACQSLPSPPEDPTPATLVPSSGNLPPPAVDKVKRCKRGFVKKRGQCVKKKGKAKRRQGGKKR